MEAAYSKTGSSDNTWHVAGSVRGGLDRRCTFVEKGLKLGEQGLNSRVTPETEYTGLSE